MLYHIIRGFQDNRKKRSKAEIITRYVTKWSMFILIAHICILSFFSLSHTLSFLVIRVSLFLQLVFVTNSGVGMEKPVLLI